MLQSTYLKKISAEQKFMLSALIVNAGNYLYNLILGRLLGPKLFADAAILITFLLVLSFMAMTFQLATAKFSVIFEKEIFQNFISKTYKNATLCGVFFGLLIILFSKKLQLILNTDNFYMFIIFGIGVPIYFVMSVNRGILQGKSKFVGLSWSYQLEMLSRLSITLLFLWIFNINSSILVALGIVFSLFFSLIPYQGFVKAKANVLNKSQISHVKNFFLLTAFYELTQIIINNSDILLVKHYFEAYESGLYASLALIGRVVYFVAWMFVMVLLPKVVSLHKEGKPTQQVLLKYVMYILLLSLFIVFVCYAFPTFVVQLLFGSAYLSIASLLWKYAIATSVFAISNIFAYYFLSLDRYIPVFISGILGVAQVALIIFFHKSLAQVVYVQIIAMCLLLVVQLFYFFVFGKK